jgi:hypothetical protein
MVGSRKRRRAEINGHQHPENGTELNIRSAELSTPDFDESWRAGAPLNWVDFVDHWDRRRASRKASRRATNEG